MLPYWVCMTSCENKGNSVLVRLLMGKSVQCLGPDSTRCSWFMGSSNCSELAPGEPAPDPANEEEYQCSEADMGGGWCWNAAEVIANRRPNDPCPTTETTTTTVSGPSPTPATAGSSTTAGPSPTAQEPQSRRA